MTVYVDELHIWSTTIDCMRKGSCHLTADTLDELHEFAKKIGLRRGWFQDRRIESHYDLTPARRAKALRAGAVFVPAKEQARTRIAARRKMAR